MLDCAAHVFIKRYASN